MLVGRLVAALRGGLGGKLGGLRGISKLSAKPSLFRFGICADIQYVAADDDFNFQKTKVRRYRQSLEIFREAVEHWHGLEDVKFALVLGDILDGKTSIMKNQVSCLDEVLDICRRGASSANRGGSFSSAAGMAYFPTLGNHDYYAFSRSELHARLYRHIPGTSTTKLYYDFSPHPAWRFISLDAYDVSLIGASSETHRLQAAELLSRHNPNDLNTVGTWFNNMPRDKYRFVPYNGGIGEVQLHWFAQTLADARQQKQRCIIFCHQPTLAPDKPQSVLWNSEAVRDVMKASGNVALWIAGHDHDGQFNQCEDAVYHLVPPAPIECGVGEKAYGTIEVYEDKLQLSWTGREPGRPTLRPWGGTREMLLSRI